MAAESPARQRFSLVLITLNAEAQLAACLESVPGADEIVILDSGSRDDTAEIARRFGARFLHQNWRGFGAQKNAAVAAASHDWVLCLDADERLSPELHAAILEALRQPRASAYRMARCNRFLGRWLRHGEGYPDWSLRLFDRRAAQWSEATVHEKVHARGAVGTLAGDLLHASAESLDEYLAKQNRYTSLQAEALFGLGRETSTAKMLLSPLTRFCKFYFLRRGFLDGVPGLVHICIGCFNSFMKYAKLRALQAAKAQA
ncbi:(heptosyl)LPS beta-1,4-glucosyltransferase [Planctomycetaceae bacterium]|nr:MAG: glycosyltransferase family 2 protein [Burkholderiales bacterium]CAG0931695.1 (heptosyl)LPS beta-1,4-glucosyltransferase [Planctomycetaceae bacterium]